MKEFIKKINWIVHFEFNGYSEKFYIKCQSELPFKEFNNEFNLKELERGSNYCYCSLSESNNEENIIIGIRRMCIDKCDIKKDVIKLSIIFYDNDLCSNIDLLNQIIPQENLKFETDNIKKDILYLEKITNYLKKIINKIEG